METSDMKKKSRGFVLEEKKITKVICLQGNAIQDGLNSGGYLKLWLNAWAKVTVSRTIMPKLGA